MGIAGWISSFSYMIGVVSASEAAFLTGVKKKKINYIYKYLYSIYKFIL